MDHGFKGSLVKGAVLQVSTSQNNGVRLEGGSTAARLYLIPFFRSDCYTLNGEIPIASDIDYNGGMSRFCVGLLLESVSDSEISQCYTELMEDYKDCAKL